MAEPIQYTPKPIPIDPDANEELARLLQTAHEHGVLRFANDLIASNQEWTRVLADGLNTEGSRKGAQNLLMMLMMLSRTEPERLCKVLFAAKGGFDHLASAEPATSGKADAPGIIGAIIGAWKLLNDDALWRAATPLIEALRIFGAGLDRDVHKPISAFSGKQTKKP